MEIVQGSSVLQREDLAPLDGGGQGLNGDEWYFVRTARMRKQDEIDAATDAAQLVKEA